MTVEQRNLLAEAASPYLRQHADNPVWWRPWGETALAEARERRALLLVSIGYSTCHWCHVMAHESFEDDELAALMNEHFVNVKVDREEHPEVDEIYMEACQAMTGQGGWPLNAICTPDGVPVYVGTYFPPPQWRQLLEALAATWREEPDQLRERAVNVRAFLERDALPEHSQVPDGLSGLLEAIESSYDEAHPGYGQGAQQAPKFPPNNQLLCLLGCDGRGLLSGAQRERHILAVLEAMQDSGLHDRVGGGFHRYSVDRQWRAPHFEKMLYDNALLMVAYAEAGERRRRPDFRRTAIGIGDYLLRDMRLGEAAWGLAAAEDADDPGGEGAFYGWPPDELRRLLGDQAEGLIADWDLAPGTAERGRGGTLEPIPEHIPHPRGSARFGGLPAEEREQHRLAWEPFLPKLLAARSQRPRPGRDDKLLTDLNGLALQSFATLARLTGEERHADACRGLVALIEGRRRDEGLIRMPGDPPRPAYITDYGCALLGLTAAFDALGDVQLIELAEAVASEAVERLRDPRDGSFYTTPAGREDLVRRSKELFDGPMPGGQNALALGFARLHGLTGADRWRQLAEDVVGAAAMALERAPHAACTLVAAQQLLLHGAVEIVVTGPREQVGELLAAARRLAPWEARIVPGWTDRDWPILEGRRDLDRPQALVCVGTNCLAPAFTVGELRDRLHMLGGRD